MDKGGILGGTMVTFVATIIIVIILLVFSFGAMFVKTVDKSAGGLAVVSEGKVGLGDVWDYMPNYFKLVRVRVLVEGGRKVDDAISEVGYVK